MIAVEDVHKAFGDIKVFRGLDLRIDKGDRPLSLASD